MVLKMTDLSPTEKKHVTGALQTVANLCRAWGIGQDSIQAGKVEREEHPIQMEARLAVSYQVSREKFRLDEVPEGTKQVGKHPFRAKKKREVAFRPFLRDPAKLLDEMGLSLDQHRDLLRILSGGLDGKFHWHGPQGVVRKCSQCRGKGMVKCPNCRGRGSVRGTSKAVMNTRMQPRVGGNPVPGEVRGPGNVVYTPTPMLEFEKRPSSRCHRCQGKKVLPCNTCGTDGRLADVLNDQLTLRTSVQIMNEKDLPQPVQEVLGSIDAGRLPQEVALSLVDSKPKRGKLDLSLTGTVRELRMPLRISVDQKELSPIARVVGSSGQCLAVPPFLDEVLGKAVAKMTSGPASEGLREAQGHPVFSRIVNAVAKGKDATVVEDMVGEWKGSLSKRAVKRAWRKVRGLYDRFGWERIAWVWAAIAATVLVGVSVAVEAEIDVDGAGLFAIVLIAAFGGFFFCSWLARRAARQFLGQSIRRTPRWARRLSLAATVALIGIGAVLVEPAMALV